MIRYDDYISPEEYLELRKMVGWRIFPLEEAKNCVENAYMVLCVRDNERAVGVVRLSWDGGYVAFLSDVIVAPEYQGQGAGSRFLQMIEEDTKKRGLSGIFLQTDNDKPAYGFYQRRNFKELTEHVSFFKVIS